jgi:hypothetical protein
VETKSRYVKHNFSYIRLQKKLIEIDKNNLLQRSPRTAAILKELFSRGGSATSVQLREALFPGFDLCNLFTQQDLAIQFTIAIAKAKSRAKKFGIEIHYDRKTALWFGLAMPKRRKRSVAKRIIADDKENLTATLSSRNQKKISKEI